MCKNRMRVAGVGLNASSCAHVLCALATVDLQPATFVALGGAQFESHRPMPVCTFAQAKCLAYL